METVQGISTHDPSEKWDHLSYRYKTFFIRIQIDGVPAKFKYFSYSFREEKRRFYHQNAESKHFLKIIFMLIKNTQSSRVELHLFGRKKMYILDVY